MADAYNFGNGTYFDRAKNIGAVNGRETRDYNEYLRWGGPSLDSGAANPPHIKSPDEVMRDLQAETQKQIDELAKRSKEFDATHPFSFDELLAKAAIEQRYNPYYEAQLKDFMSGINRQRESIGQETDLIKTLNTQAQGQEARDLGEAIKASAEGASQAGLFFSGARQRETGLKEIRADEVAKAREARTNFNLDEFRRQLGQVDTTEQSTRRGFTADKATQVQTEIEKQKAEENARLQYEKGQYLGKYATNPESKSYMNQLLGYTYTS